MAVRKSKFTNRLEKEYGDQLKSKSKTNLSKFFKIPMSVLNESYDRGLAAYRNNPSSVRPSVSSPHPWARARMNKLILNIVDVRANKKKINKKAGEDGDLVARGL